MTRAASHRATIASYGGHLDGVCDVPASFDLDSIREACEASLALSIYL